jgi:hypothetical protein
MHILRQKLQVFFFHNLQVWKITSFVLLTSSSTLLTSNWHGPNTFAIYNFTKCTCCTEFIILNSIIADALHNLHEMFHSDEFNYWCVCVYIYIYIYYAPNYPCMDYPVCGLFEVSKFYIFVNANMWTRLLSHPVVKQVYGHVCAWQGERKGT